jgi:hypothetical protein
MRKPKNTHKPFMKVVKPATQDKDGNIRFNSPGQVWDFLEQKFQKKYGRSAISMFEEFYQKEYSKKYEASEPVRLEELTLAIYSGLLGKGHRD